MSIPLRAARGAALGLAFLMAAAAPLAAGAAKTARTVKLDAVIAEGAAPMSGAVTFRVWALDGDGGGRMVAEEAGAPAKLRLAPGPYRIVAQYEGARSVHDIRIGEAEQQHRLINLNAGEVSLSLLPRVNGKPISKPLEWEVRRYARGSEKGDRVAAMRHAKPELFLTEGWYEVEVSDGDQVVSHVIEVAAGTRYDYTLVKE